MAEARVLIDLEFGFTHGDPLLLDLVQGRDTVEMSETSIRVVKQVDEQTTEDTVIERDRLNWRKLTTRVINEPTVDERMADE